MSAGLDEVAYARVLGEYQPRPIHDDHENERAMSMLEQLAAVQDPAPAQLAVGDILVTLIEGYEQRYGIAKASPLDILRELTEANDMKQMRGTGDAWSLHRRPIGRLRRVANAGDVAAFEPGVDEISL